MCVGDLDGVSGKSVAASQLTTKADGMVAPPGPTFTPGLHPREQLRPGGRANSGTGSPPELPKLIFLY